MNIAVNSYKLSGTSNVLVGVVVAVSGPFTIDPTASTIDMDSASGITLESGATMNAGVLWCRVSISSTLGAFEWEPGTPSPPSDRHIFAHGGQHRQRHEGSLGALAGSFMLLPEVPVVIFFTRGEWSMGYDPLCVVKILGIQW